MAVKLNFENERLVAYLSGEIDHHLSKQMRCEIDESLIRVNPKVLELNFKDVTFMDSSGIGLVMGRYRQMKFYGGELKVINTSPHIYKVMKIAGLDRLAVIEKGIKSREKAI